MDEQRTLGTDETLSFRDKHLFSLMIIGAIMIALALVIISMELYNSSGAAQLDLSRPGYKDVRAQVVSNDDFKDYSSSGPIDQAAVNEFVSIYNQQAKKTESVDAFGGDPLSADALGISATSTGQ
jgi:hypothetical protein